MKKSLLMVSALTLLAPALSFAGAGKTAGCSAPVIKVLNQVQKDIEFYYTITTLAGDIDVEITLDALMPYRSEKEILVCTDDKEGVRVNRTGKVFGFLKVRTWEGGWYQIDSATVTENGLLKFEFGNENVPYWGMNLKTKALILKDGTQIKASK
ncbi:hypothetical protein [Bdellovibrio sp. HCB2-146]|uniref:hypothetical protein n=1 Tax=Bdellovibrio sp. HCB2-146 TaxID=3394362 RepID=UPI0039BD1EA3